MSHRRKDTLKLEENCRIAGLSKDYVRDIADAAVRNYQRRWMPMLTLNWTPESVPGHEGGQFNLAATTDAAKDISIDRKEYNRRMMRPDGAGASWTEKEDQQLGEEYGSGMSISEIAKVHERTNGAIRARLKKHGLIE